MQFFINSILYSYSQIFFSNRRWFGLFALAATLAMPSIGLGGLAGVIITNLTALLLKFDKKKIESGFYGFNGLLFGAALFFFFKPTPPVIYYGFLFAILSFLISAVIEHFFAEAFNLPGLSFPFIITLYLFIFFTNSFPDIKMIGFELHAEYFEWLHPFMQKYFAAMGIILFQPSVIAGIIVTVGVFVFSRTLFSLSLLSFTFAYYAVPILLGEVSVPIFLLIGFNVILMSFAAGGCLILISRKTVPLVLFSVVITIILFQIFLNLTNKTNLPVLVLPFNFLLLPMLYGFRFRKEQTDFTLLYFLPGSPEENYYYHQNRTDRFNKSKYYYTELPFMGSWKVSQGYNGQITHKDDWRHALDFVVEDDNGKQFKNEGQSLSDYFCFELPVIAPLGGDVVKVVDDVEDNKPGDVNLINNWGNTVVIQHDYGFYSAVSHLEKGSIKVKEGAHVNKGEVIAACGNNGRSPYPHIHFQFQEYPEIGSNTLEYPFLGLIKENENRKTLLNFAVPAEGDKVKNIEVNKAIKKVFNFNINETLTFSVKRNSREFVENWKVKVSINNRLYIENQFGDIAYLYNTDKIFFVTSYIGAKNSALYYFYLSALQIPLTFEEDLCWVDKTSLANLPVKFLQSISELVLVLAESFATKSFFRMYTNEQQKKTIESEICIEGKHFLGFYKKNFKTIILLNKTNQLYKLRFMEKDKTVFEAELTEREMRYE